LLIVAAILFIVAALCAFDFFHANAEGFALLGLASWSGSGAV
jgi:hypothetical protein